MNSSLIIYTLFAVLLAFSCSRKQSTKKIIVSNTLNIERSFETVALSKAFLDIEDLSLVGLRSVKTNQMQITQAIDNDGDSIPDELLFQPTIGAKSQEIFDLIIISEEYRKEENDHCYSRFVPERTDDYAWENNKVAFRTFGPAAQKLVEDGLDGGTLTSGIDIWLKKVEYPIIDKWYKKTIEGLGSYHKDTGEGLDNFHVGASRGVGGIAVKSNGVYYFSKNFINYKTLATGPIRTSFELEYGNWNAGDRIIKESKTISLDFGSNLTRIETFIEGVDTISVGLTLHENDGNVSMNKENGWLNYWQPHGDSELGTAVLSMPSSLLGVENFITEEKDLSHAYAELKVEDNNVVYYAGFAWKESGQFINNDLWENYLDLFAKKVENPLIVTIAN